MRRQKAKGANMIEYALLAALVAVAIIPALNLLAQGINGTFGAVNVQMTTATAASNPRVPGPATPGPPRAP